METWVQTEGFHQYLIFGTRELTTDSFTANMLLHYQGKRLLPVELQCQQGMVNISYDVTGMCSLEQMIKQQEWQEQELRMLFQAIYKCYDEMYEYFLPPEGILLSPQWVFYQSEKEEFRFCYCPEMTTEVSKQMLELAEFCMKHISHKDTGAVLFIYRLYCMLQRGCVEPDDIWKYFSENLQEHKKIPEAKEADGIGITEEKQMQEGIQVAGEKQVGEDVQFMRKKQADEGRQMFGKKVTVYIYGSLTLLFVLAGTGWGVRFLFIAHQEGDLKTAVLLWILGMVSAYSTVQSRKSRQDKTDTGFVWCLEGQKGEEAIELMHLPAVLGRKAGKVDYVISEEGVSRRHLRVFEQDGHLFAEDMGSTNGTYLNGRRLEIDIPMEIQEGDILLIGRKQYTAACKRKDKRER